MELEHVYYQLQSLLVLNNSGKLLEVVNVRLFFNKASEDLQHE